MKNLFQTVMAATIPFILLSFMTAQGQNSTTFRKGAEKAVGGITKEEREARQAELFDWLRGETPAGTLDTPVHVEVSQQELTELAEPHAPPLRIGLVKSITPAIDIAELQRGQVFKKGGRVAGGIFQETDDGGFVWALTIMSPNAIGIRLHFRNFSIPDDADLYFYSPNGQVRGPYQRQGPNNTGEFWTNTVFSETGVVVLRHFGKYTAEDLRNVSFVITDLGHIGRGFPKPIPVNHSWRDDKCGNPLCVVDANCENVAPADQSSIAKMEWIQGAFIYSCTGGLIADTDGSSQRNLFLTANHCLSKSSSNLETFFNYTTDSCMGECPGSPAPDTTGATVLASGRKGDYTLMELSQDPPSGSTFLGWNNSPIAFTNGADLYRVSNPNFGPQVFSRHTVDTVAGTCTQWPRGERIYSRDVEGATDGGSSGSPVVISGMNGGEIVGQLSGACGYNPDDACDSASNSTVDGALAFYYDKVAQFLDPGTSTECSSNTDCDDGVFCNGAETCSGGMCQSGTAPCQTGEICSEASETCVAGECPLGAKGDACFGDTDCCSNKCKGPSNAKTCR